MLLRKKATLNKPVLNVHPICAKTQQQSMIGCAVTLHEFIDVRGNYES